MKINVVRSNWGESSSLIYRELLAAEGEVRLFQDIMAFLGELVVDQLQDYRIAVEITAHNVFIDPSPGNTVALPQLAEAFELNKTHSGEALKELWKKEIDTDDRYRFNTLSLARVQRRLSAELEMCDDHYRVKINY